MSPLVFVPLSIALGREDRFLKVRHGFPDRQPHPYQHYNLLKLCVERRSWVAIITVFNSDIFAKFSKKEI